MELFDALSGNLSLIVGILILMLLLSFLVAPARQALENIKNRDERTKELNEKLLAVVSSHQGRPLPDKEVDSSIRRAKELLEHGADINCMKEPEQGNSFTMFSEKMTPLHCACSCGSGNEKMIRFLIYKGAKTRPIDSKGYTPLMTAINVSHTEVVKCLLEEGVRVGARELDFAVDRARTVEKGECREQANEILELLKKNS